MMGLMQYKNPDLERVKQRAKNNGISVAVNVPVVLSVILVVVLVFIVVLIAVLVVILVAVVFPRHRPSLSSPSQRKFNLVPVLLLLPLHNTKCSSSCYYYCCY